MADDFNILLMNLTRSILILLESYWRLPGQKVPEKSHFLLDMSNNVCVYLMKKSFIFKN